MMIIHTYTTEEIENSGWTKEGLAHAMHLINYSQAGKLEFDYALPQGWVDKWTDIFKNNTSLAHLADYIVGTTFWVYTKQCRAGIPVSGCNEIQRFFDTGRLLYC